MDTTVIMANGKGFFGRLKAKFFGSKKRTAWTAVVLLAAGLIGAAVFGGDKESQYVTDAVKRLDLTQTVQATGTVESATEINLNFGTSGRVSLVRAEVGKAVKAGDLLASLDASSLEARVADADAGLAAQRAALDKLRNGSTPEELALAQATLDAAKVTLENAKRQRDTEISNQLRTIGYSMDKELFNAITALDTVNRIITDQSYISVLGTLDSSLKERVLTDVIMSKKELEAKQRELATRTTSDVQAAQSVTFEVTALLSRTSRLLTDAYSVLAATNVTGSLSQTTLDGFKASVQTQQSTVRASIASLQTALSTLLSSVSTYDSSVSAAEKNVQVNQAQLDIRAARARPDDVAAQEARVNQAAAGAQALRAQLRDMRIVAPIDGTVTKVDAKLGAQAIAGTPYVGVIGNSDLQVRVDVPEADVAKIKANDAVRMTFDAFGRDRVIEGSVALIDPASTKIQDAVYYRVKVAFKEPQALVKSGMTADTYIATASRPNALVIPQRAVRETNGKRVVDVYEKKDTVETVAEREVTLGLRGDDGLVEVVSGLTEGESVVTLKRAAK